MGKKKKKKQKVNNDKFNFDDEYIIGFSDSATVTKKSIVKEKSKKKKNVKNGNGKKIQQAKQKNQVRGNRKIFTVLIIIVLLVAFVCFLLFAPVFNVQTIAVVNNEKISSEVIVELSEIQLNKNLFMVEKIGVIDRIKKNPYIESVKVSRVLPDTIRITVEERSEKYLVEFAESRYAVLDGQGHILDFINEKKDLPVLVGVVTDLAGIERIEDNTLRLDEADLKKLDSVANIIQISQDNDLYQYITKIDIGNMTDIKLELDNGEKIVHLGSYSDMNTKILYVVNVYQLNEGKRGEIFVNGDLSNGVIFRDSVN